MNTSSITQRIRFLSSSEVTRKKALQRIRRMCSAIGEEFLVRQPEQIKLKHLLFVRDVWFERQQMSNATVEDYRRAMRLMVEALGKEGAWLVPLKLTKDPLRGGRPTVAKVLKSRARHRRGVL